MKRKILSVLLTLILCFSLAVTVSAESQRINFVYDELGYLTAEETSDLNDLGQKLYNETGVGIFFTYVMEDSLSDYDVSCFIEGITNYVIMMENDAKWYLHLGGQGQIIDSEAEEYLRGIYDETETYVEGIEAFMYAVAEYFPAVEDTTNVTTSLEEMLLLDEADLVSDAEEEQLNAQLSGISQTYNAQISVITIPTMDGGDIDQFIGYLYDNMGLGYGDKKDGVLLLVCMDPREFRILSNGNAGDVLGDSEIAAITNAITPDLSAGNYIDAFETFAEKCEYYLDGHINGFPFKFGKNLLIALVIGIVVGFIVASILKGQLKSVRKQDQANVYVKPGSMQITTSNDFFLYRNVTRTKKESSSSSSSSGSRNVGGGSF